MPLSICEVIDYNNILDNLIKCRVSFEIITMKSRLNTNIFYCRNHCVSTRKQKIWTKNPISEKVFFVSQMFPSIFKFFVMINFSLFLKNLVVKQLFLLFALMIPWNDWYYKLKTLCCGLLSSFSLTSLKPKYDSQYSSFCKFQLG